MRAYPTLIHAPSRDRLADTGRQSRRAGGTIAEARQAIAGQAARIARDAARFPGFLAHVTSVATDPTEAYALTLAATSCKGQHEAETPFRPYVDAPYFPSEYIARTIADDRGRVRDTDERRPEHGQRKQSRKANHAIMRRANWLPRI